VQACKAHIAELEARLIAYRKKVRVQAVVALCEPGETFTSGAVCALCGDGIILDDFEDERAEWTDEQWREACPHTEDCVAGEALEGEPADAN